jgi:CRISPR-associated endonuclease/helicase Cas3
VDGNILAVVGFIPTRKMQKMSKSLPSLKPDILLAKSSMPGMNDWKGSCHLVGHTAAVLQCTTILVDTLKDFWLSQFRLSCSFEALRATARLAAYLHDWGKANSHFQMVVRNDLKSLEAEYRRNPMDYPQMIRHEVASVLLAWEFRDWLQQCPHADFMTALAAAGGHHLKLGGKQGKDTGEFGDFREGSGEMGMHWYIGHPYFKKLIRLGVRTLALPNQIKLPRKVTTYWEAHEVKQKRLNILDEAFADWEPDEALLAIVKSLLIAGDSIGSASAQSEVNLQDWMAQELEQRLTEADLQGVIDAHRGKSALRPFQVALGQSAHQVTLARAGCGTGKTLGAYNWAKTFAVGQKLFFCYPTTGTSTEGFFDYVQDEVESILLHSRAKVDLEMAHTGEEHENGSEWSIDEDTGKLAQTYQENEAAQKLSSFQAWGAKVSICTVDTVLGWLQCNRRPMYCFPAIAQATFVFDEVHCYDDALFGALLRFLTLVKAPVLLMSASFLPWQIEAIEAAVGAAIEVIQGPKDLEELPRYNFHLVEQPDWQRVESELAAGGKVLWVCNQVNEAIAVYEEAQQRQISAVLYHSRFRYEDRVAHHRKVVDGFRADEPILAIATQVAEMSLDLSATLLVTQIADPAGLIQRLGRLNRQYCHRSLDAMFYPPKSRYPYDQDTLDQGKALVQSFTKDVNQAELAAWLEKSGDRGNPKTRVVLLDGKWRTYPTSLREEGYSITALLEVDQNSWKTAQTSDLAKYAVPLNAKKTKHWQRHKKGYLIAPKDEWGYSKNSGAYEIEKRKSL